MRDNSRHWLDSMEELLLQALVAADEEQSPAEQVASLCQTLDRAYEDGDPAAAPPSPDPDEARRSAAEVKTLMRLLDDSDAGSQAVSLSGSRERTGAVSLSGSRPRTRAGYKVIGDPDRHARVEPALAGELVMLARAGDRAASIEDLRRRFADLWAIDMDLWQAFGAREPRQLAALWLRSPGRRLVQDIKTIQRLAIPAEQRGSTGATDTGMDSLHRASGIAGMPRGRAELEKWLREARPARWRDLHAAVPGLLMGLWQPHDGKVTTALRRLDRGSPFTLRGAAMGWLLDRAAREPYYEIDGIRRDLRDDLPVRLATALGLDAPDAPDAVSDGTISAELEAVLLQHAAHIADPDGTRGSEPDTIRTAWGLSRWMHRCLVRSPFYGADEDSLSARLRALLDRKQPRTPGRDPLDPLRLGTDGLDVADLALVAGVMSHYGHAGPHLDPVPLPLVNALRRMAGRELRPGEREAEDAFQPPAAPPERLGQAGNALGWNAPHIAPPWVARRFLTDRRIAWLARVPDPAMIGDECLAQLERRPAVFSWLAFAFYAEGHELAHAIRERAADSWRTLAGRYQQDGEAGMPAHALAALAAGLLPALRPDEHARALDIAAAASEDWRPFLFDAFAEASERAWQGGPEGSDLSALWQEAVVRLLEAAEATERSSRERLNSALMALRRAAARRAGSGRPLLERLARAVAEPPFRDHRALQREVRRLGFDAISSRA